MKALATSLIAFLALAPIGCGGDDGNSDDSDDTDGDVMNPDARVDSMTTPDSDPSTVGCDYVEMGDATNDASSAQNVEMTQAQYNGTAFTLCGKFNSGHFVAPMTAGGFGTVDVDAFTLTVPNDSQAVINVTGTDLTTDINPQWQVFNADLSVDASGLYIENRAIGSATLSSGNYFIIVASTSKMATTADKNYRMKISLDATTGCLAGGTATNTVAETETGTEQTNNVLQIGDNYTLTTATDAPVTTPDLGATDQNAFTGTISNVNTITTDGYYDIDTYEFKTGATTNQVRVRLTWPSAEAGTDDTGPLPDVDFYLIEKPAATTVADPVSSYLGATTKGEEFAVVPVKANTSYWLVIGGYDHQPMSGTPDVNDDFPVNYATKLCGETYTP